MLTELCKAPWLWTAGGFKLKVVKKKVARHGVSLCTQLKAVACTAATWKIAQACGYNLLHLTEACGGRPFWLDPSRSVLGVSVPHPSSPSGSSSSLQLPESLQRLNARRMWASGAPVAAVNVQFCSWCHMTNPDWLCFTAAPVEDIMWKAAVFLQALCSVLSRWK